MEQINIIKFLPITINPYETTTPEQINFYDNCIILTNIVAYIFIVISIVLKIYIANNKTTIENSNTTSKNKFLKALSLLFKIIIIIFTLIMLILSLFIILLASIDYSNIPL